MKKFIIRTLLIGSVLSSQSLIYPVSCSKKSSEQFDYDLNKEYHMIKNEFTWDFYKEGLLSNQTASDKINKIGKQKEYASIYNKKILSYDTQNWDSNHFYVKVSLAKHSIDNKHNQIIISIYKYYQKGLDQNNKDITSVYLEYNSGWSYSIDDTNKSNLYSQLIDFHNKITNKSYFLDKKDMSLKDLSSNVYDDFFKTAFKSEDEIKNNVSFKDLKVYKFFEDLYFLNYKNGFEENIKNPYTDSLILDSERPFTLQLLDTNSNLGIDLNLYDNEWLINQELDRKYKEVYSYKTNSFINKSLSSLIDINNISFNFNWSIKSNENIFNILGFDFLIKLINEDKKQNPNWNENDRIYKKNNVDVTKIPDYKQMFFSNNSENKINLKQLNLSRFISLPDNNAYSFFECLFISDNEYNFFLNKSFNVLNSVLNTIHKTNSDLTPLGFFLGNISLSINNKKINFEAKSNSFKFDSQEDWANFINELINNSSGKVLKIEVDNQISGVYINFLSKFNFEVNII